MKTNKIKIFSTADIHDYHNWFESFDNNEPLFDIDLVIIAGDVQDLHTRGTNLLLTEAITSGVISIDDVTNETLEPFALHELKKLLNIKLPSKFPNAKFIIAPGNHDCIQFNKDLLLKHNKKKFYFAEDPNKLVEIFPINIKNKTIGICINKATAYDAYFKGNGKASKPYKNNLASNLDTLKAFEEAVTNNPTIKVDIIVSHCPPYKILDYVEESETNIGSIALLTAMNSYLKDANYIICGHNHIADKETIVKEFNSEGNYQTIINATSRSEPGFLNCPERSGVIFDYEPISKVKLKKFFERIKFFKHLLKKRSYPFIRSVELTSCSICNSNKIVQGGVSICNDCIKEYLENVTPYNFNDKQFDKINQMFSETKQ